MPASLGKPNETKPCGCPGCKVWIWQYEEWAMEQQPYARLRRPGQSFRSVRTGSVVQRTIYFDGDRCIAVE